MDGALIIDKLTVRFGARAAVRQVTLHAALPGWWGILDGSGKTTLLRAIGGRLTPQEGRIWLSGADLTDDPAKRAQTVGYAPGLDTLPEALTAKELVELAARARGAEPERPSELFEALGLAQLANRRISAMSSGMRQRVAVFCAFLGSPRVVLLDEPFNWLDPVAVYDVKRCFVEIARNTTLITALHDVATFATRCTGGVLMHDGEIARTFDAAEIARAGHDLPAFERGVYDALRRRT